MATISDLKRRLASIKRWMAVLQDGLDGRPQTLSASEAKAFEQAMAALGVSLLSKTKAAKSNLELRRGSKPVVRRYYGAPIADFHDLFVLEQFTRMKNGE